MPSGTAPGESEVVKALGIAYRFLNGRERTEQEVRRHLAKSIEDQRAADVAVQELLDQGYVDDRRYARLYTEDKAALEGWGRERIHRGLSERGIEREWIDEALAGLGAADERARARELLARRFPAPPATRQERDRALGMLLRKGFTSEVALEAIGSTDLDLP